MQTRTRGAATRRWRSLTRKPLTLTLAPTPTPNPNQVRESRLGAEALVRRDKLIEEQREAERIAKREAAAGAARLAQEEAVRQEVAQGVLFGVAAHGVAHGVAAQGGARQPLEGVAHQPSSIGVAAGAAAEYTPPAGGGCDNWCDDEVPDDFICPITAELMHDPVLAYLLEYSLWLYLLPTY